MMTWTILWAALWLNAAGEVSQVVVELEEPKFDSQDECEAYLLKYKTPMTFALAKHLELAPGTRFAAEGKCQITGQQT